jgi:very-short-patch-repair endonuclease
MSARRLTQEEFITKAKIIHGDKYDYSLVEYNGSRVKIKIICPIHGVFEQRASDHLEGANCCKCSNPIRIRLTTEEFIEKANKFHNNKFDYSLTQYINNGTNVKVICPTHGVFECMPGNHTRDFISCPGCIADNKSKLYSKTTKQFVADAKKVHGKAYDYSLVEYTNNDTNIKIICPIHGVFEQRPSNHLSGCGCPSCNSSRGEKKVLQLLKDNDIKFVPQKKFDDCKGKKFKLSFDFYLPDYNVCVEYDGRQHFEQVERWGNHKLEDTQTNDAIKTAYCKANNIPLIRIRYDEDIEQRVLKLLESLKVA